MAEREDRKIDMSHPAPYLRSVLEDGDPGTLAELLSDHDFPDSLRQSMLKEFPDLSWQMRTLLLHPELAGSITRNEGITADSNPSPSDISEKSTNPERSGRDPLFSYRIRAGAKWPVLRTPLSEMPVIRNADIHPFGTDGLRFYLPEKQAETARTHGPGKNSGKAVTWQDFQHMLMHAVFHHMAFPEKIGQRAAVLAGKELPLWNLACDMAAEYLRTLVFPEQDAREIRLSVTASLPAECDPKEPPAIYAALSDLFEDELEGLFARFTRDDHRYWYRAPDNIISGTGGAGTGQRMEDREKIRDYFAGAAAFSEKKEAGTDERTVSLDAARISPDPYGELPSDVEDPAQWQKYLARTTPAVWFSAEEEMASGTGKTSSGRYGLAPGSREEKMILREMGKYDFTAYLRRFSTTREEMRIDQANFDYIPYYYGLERYGNMPLFEPLEYTESRKVEELVIAIDTSGSCSLPIVQRFFAEIERILLNSDNFFRKMNIQIIQCDSIIQDHTAIHSQEEWKRYREDLTIKGRGGTDFNPVFRLVEKLREKGEIKELKGLLYFTDGDGAYPRYPTDYETAFVFTTRKALQFKIPEWIVPLCLDMAPAEKAPMFRA